MNSLGLISLKEELFERIWGGRKLKTIFERTTPADASIGEAWLLSDHAQHVSVVDEGPHAGRDIHELLLESESELLGSHARPTDHGRFPLMLKLLDASQWLSVQVHPNDDMARQLGEADVGKTEMWHVLDADPDSELICGLKPKVDAEGLQHALDRGAILDTLETFKVIPGDSVFVRAGTVHAIGHGIVLAEIQQNSDVTYRIYDWDRKGPDGKAREMHLEKALQVTDFTSHHRGKCRPLMLEEDLCRRSVLAACRYFAAELVDVEHEYLRETGGRSFHILLAKTGTVSIDDGRTTLSLAPGRAALVPGCVPAFSVRGSGSFLDYYVPDLEKDVFAPLSRHGHSRNDILALGADYGG